ncbi:MAG TPA: DUF5666 domain-containing protein [Thermoanaerobaculia bacterium]|nr:DUF5666 domain-containing protein [Thermoanaerobaculia bacterium]
MPRKLVALALVLFACSAFARTRSVAAPDARVDNGAGTVTGTVSSVSGNLIQLAGVVTIDAAGAKISVDHGREGTIADVKPGMQLFAALRASSNNVLSAAIITVTDPTDVTLSGTVASVDAASKTFSLLNQTIYTDANTSFGGYKREAGTTFADIQPNVIVYVAADVVVNGKLLAREVLVVAPAPPRVGHARGTVQSIGTDSWTIRTEDGATLALVVNAQTKIAGSPRVGDTVEVLYTINSANENVAVSIIKFEHVTPPQVFHFHGNVKSIAGTTWTMSTDNGDKTFTVNESTKIISIAGTVGVGDLVDVLAVTRDDGSLLAVTITKLRL